VNAFLPGSLDESVASLFPLDLSGDVVALRACVDAGTQDGVFSVAAVAFGYDRAVRANGEWERLLKGRTFHMTDLHSRKGEFKDIQDDEVHTIMVGTVRIIRQYASYVVAVSCDASQVADGLPVVSEKHPDMENLLAALRSPYGFMCHIAMTGLGMRANNNGPGRQISYVFERGDDGQKGLRRYLEYLGDEPHHLMLLDGYSFSRLTVADKDKIEGVFHASDLLAWEWARHVDRHKNGKPIRRSLAELAGRASAHPDVYGMSLINGRTFFCRHFSYERLAALAEYFRESLAATTVEEQNAVFNRYRAKYPGPGPEEALKRLSQGE
jgi:hypothetical protein